MPYPPTPEEPDGDLSPEDRDRLIEQLARKIVSRGLETPAILFLEMHKPVAFVAGQSLLVAGPFLAPLFGIEGVNKYSRLLGDRENVELLIRRIEDISAEKSSRKRNGT
jgi:hypothetical protein